MSLIGPSRHFAASQQFGRFRSEADIELFTLACRQIVLKKSRCPVPHSGQ